MYIRPTSRRLLASHFERFCLDYFDARTWADGIQARSDGVDAMEGTSEYQILVGSESR